MRGLNNETNAKILEMLEALFWESPRVKASDLMSGKLDGRLIINREHAQKPVRVIMRRIEFDPATGIVNTPEVIWTSTNGTRRTTSRKPNSPANVVSNRYRLPSIEDASKAERMILREIEEAKSQEFASVPTHTPEPDHLITARHTTGSYATITSTPRWEHDIVEDTAGVQKDVLIQSLLHIENRLCDLLELFRKQVEISEQTLEFVKKF